MNMETIRQQLTQLRLPSAAENFESVLASRKIKSDFSWLSTLLEHELNT